MTTPPPGEPIPCGWVSFDHGPADVSITLYDDQGEPMITYVACAGNLPVWFGTQADHDADATPIEEATT